MLNPERKPAIWGIRLGLAAVALSTGLAAYFGYELDNQVAVNTTAVAALHTAEANLATADLLSTDQVASLQTAEANLATSRYVVTQGENILRVVQGSDEASLKAVLKQMTRNSDLATEQAYLMSGYRVEATQDILTDNPLSLKEVLSVIPPEQMVNSVQISSRDAPNSIPADFELVRGSGLVTKIDSDYIYVITAGHVVEDAGKFPVIFLSRPQFDQKLHIFDMAKDVQYVQSPDKDLGLIRITRRPGDGMDKFFPSVNINDHWQPNALGETLTGFSYPHTNSDLKFFPSIFQVKDVGANGRIPLIEEFYLGDSVGWFGASGGVIFNSHKEAVALYIAGHQHQGTLFVTLQGYSDLALELQP